jgi:hypothetical protein
LGEDTSQVEVALASQIWNTSQLSRNV